MKHSTNTYTAKINAMISVNNISMNRLGLITNCLHAIIGYQQKRGAYDHLEMIDTLNKAQAWMEWADMLPNEKWIDYAAARKIPFRFNDLWKEYKASGTTETFMTWWENK